jgi:hypothetical protein
VADILNICNSTISLSEPPSLAKTNWLIPETKKYKHKNGKLTETDEDPIGTQTNPKNMAVGPIENQSTRTSNLFVYLQSYRASLLE